MPRKYTIKNRDEYVKARLAGLQRIRDLGKGRMGGCKKGVPHKKYKSHYDNPSAGESRTGIYVLSSSSNVINACARARGVTNVVFVKWLTDELKKSDEFKHLFGAPSVPPKAEAIPSLNRD